MKRILLTFSAMALAITMTLAQAPDAFKYQAIARNTNDIALVNRNVSVRMTILKGSITGSSEYVEIHNIVTNRFGLFTLEVGNGTPMSGVFSNIDWGADSYFLRIETDVNGGNVFEVMGNSELLSVPYALYSSTSGRVFTAGNGIAMSGDTITNTEPDQTVVLTGTGATDISGTYPNFTINSTDNVIDNDADPGNEIQALSALNDTIRLTNGGSVSLTKYLDNTDNQSLSISNDTISLSNGGSIVLPVDQVDDADNNPTNELQVLSISNDTIFLSDGGFVKLLPPFDGDFSSLVNVPVNLDIDVTDDFDGQYSSLTGTPTNVSIFTNDAGYITSEVDASTTNELQTISKASSLVTLSNGGGSFTDEVDDADNDPSNEMQTLSFTAPTLSISGGNSVTLSTSSTPIGVIVMWSGTIGAIPSGWALCDGNNGTPNLLDRFILSIGTSENPGVTGGSSTHTHSGATSTDGAHKHKMPIGVSGGSVFYHPSAFGASDAFSSYAQIPISSISVRSVATTLTSSTGAHHHDYTTGSGMHTPPFFKLAYIMKK